MFKTTLGNVLMILGFGISWIVLPPAAQAADIPHGRDCATATEAKLGAEVSTTFANAADRAVYRIVLDARGLIDVAVIAGEANVRQYRIARFVMHPGSARRRCFDDHRKGIRVDNS